MDLKVFITAGESVCSECGEQLGRHAETNYDELLSRGMDRQQAREEVQDGMDIVLDHWRNE